MRANGINFRISIAVLAGIMAAGVTSIHAQTEAIEVVVTEQDGITVATPEPLDSILYFDADWEPSTVKDAYYYRAWKRIDDSSYIVNDYHMSDTLQMTARATSVLPLINHGPSTFYYSNGRKEREGNYINDRKEGLWKYWYPNGTKESSCTYRNGRKEGRQQEWHNNGKIKSDGVYKNDIGIGIWKYWFRTGQVSAITTLVTDSTPYTGTFYFKSGRVSARETRQGGSYDLISAEYWNEDGSQHPDATDIYRKPSFKNGEEYLEEFIYRNLQYPDIAARNGIEGDVTLRILVSSEGKALDVSVAESSSPLFEAEALRLGKLLKIWAPGKTHNRPDDMYDTVPIPFILH